MALTSQHCRSCGAATATAAAAGADPEAPEAPEQPEPLCPACRAIEQAEDADAAEDADESADSYQPAERVMVNCPRCEALNAVNASVPLHRQRCEGCGQLMRDPRSKRKRRNQPSRTVTADGLLRKRSRERVWMPMLGVTLVVVIAAAYLMRLNSREEPKTAEPTETAGPDERAKIEQAVTSFLSAKSAAELQPLLREPDKFGAAMQKWLEARPGALPLGGQIGKIGYLKEFAGTRFSIVIVSFPDGLRKPVFAVETPQGFRVDWRAFSETGDLTVAEFIAQKPAAPALILAAVRRSDYYNHAYQNPGEWECLKVTSGNGEHSFFAYASRRNTALMAALSPLPPLPVRRSQPLNDSPRPMALRVHFTRPPGGSENNAGGKSTDEGEILQAEVESIAGDGWYVP